MKTAFYTTAAVLVLLGGLAVLDKNNDFSLTQRENVHKFGATYMTMNNPFFEVINETIRATVESNGDILITRDPALDAVRQTQQTGLWAYAHERTAGDARREDRG